MPRGKLHQFPPSLVKLGAWKSSDYPFQMHSVVVNLVC